MAVLSHKPFSTVPNVNKRRTGTIASDTPGWRFLANSSMQVVHSPQDWQRKRVRVFTKRLVYNYE
jgi:hypothetical protein